MSSPCVPEGPGWIVELTTTPGKRPVVRQTFCTAADLSTAGVDLQRSARRHGAGRLRPGGMPSCSAGLFQGKKVAREFAGAGAPWNQLFQMGLGPFALSGGESFQFRSIGTQGPGELKIGKFTVTRQDAERITLAGKEFRLDPFAHLLERPAVDLLARRLLVPPGRRPLPALPRQEPPGRAAGGLGAGGGESG